MGIPCQPPGHALAAATPRTVARIVRLGYEVAVERGAGAAAMSTMTVPGRIASTAARSRRMGERRPGMFAVVMTMSAPAASRA